MPDDKRLPYESDIRVPLLVRAPKNMRQTLGNITSAVVSAIANATVLNIDLAPTLLDIAGLPPSPDMDGTSFCHTLSLGVNTPCAATLRWGQRTKAVPVGAAS